MRNIADHPKRVCMHNCIVTGEQTRPKHGQEANFMRVRIPNSMRCDSTSRDSSSLQLGSKITAFLLLNPVLDAYLTDLGPN